MRANVCYNAGRSYTMQGQRFEQGRNVLVTDPATIKLCQETAGFSVQILEDKKVRRVKKTAEVAVAEDEDLDS